MKKIIVLIVIFVSIFLLTGISQGRYRTICIMNQLYYDWDGRQLGCLIPVLDKQGNPIPCE